MSGPRPRVVLFAGCGIQPQTTVRWTSMGTAEGKVHENFHRSVRVDMPWRVTGVYWSAWSCKVNLMPMANSAEIVTTDVESPNLHGIPARTQEMQQSTPTCRDSSRCISRMWQACLPLGIHPEQVHMLQ